MSFNYTPPHRASDDETIEMKILNDQTGIIDLTKDKTDEQTCVYIDLTEEINPITETIDLTEEENNTTEETRAEAIDSIVNIEANAIADLPIELSVEVQNVEILPSVTTEIAQTYEELFSNIPNLSPSDHDQTNTFDFESYL